MSSPWIGLYQKEEENSKNYIEYKKCTKEDTVVFNAPVKPGLYEVRFFSSSYKMVAAESVIITGLFIFEFIVKQ